MALGFPNLPNLNPDGDPTDSLAIRVQKRVARFISHHRSRVECLMLSLLVATGFLVRIWGMSKAHFWDEMVYLQNAQVICCGKTNYSELDFRPPLISLLFAGVFLLWRHIFAACIVTALLNAVGPLFLYLAGRLAVGRLPAVIAALFLAFSPFYVGVFPDGFTSDDTGNSLLTDSPALTLVLLAFWLLLQALDRPSNFRFAWAGFALALSILMRFGTLPCVGILFLLPLAAQQRWKALLSCGFGLLVGLAPYLLWSRLNYGGFFSTLQAGWTHAEESAESPFFYLHNIGAIFTSLAVFGFAVAASSELWRGISARSSRPRPAILAHRPSPTFLRIFLWSWFVLEFFLFSAMPHKEPRYILPLAPPFLLLASSGLALFCTWPRQQFRPAGSLLLAVLMFLTFLPIRERFSRPFIDHGDPVEMRASQYLQTALPPETVLYMTFNYPSFAFYTTFGIHELSAHGSALEHDIEQIPPGNVLVVYRKTDEVREPDIDWVDRNSKFQRMRDFSAFVIYRRVAETSP